MLVGGALTCRDTFLLMPDFEQQQSRRRRTGEGRISIRASLTALSNAPGVRPTFSHPKFPHLLHNLETRRALAGNTLQSYEISD